MIIPARRISLAIWLVPVGVTIFFLFADLWMYAVQQSQSPMGQFQGEVVVREGEAHPLTVTNKGWTRLRIDHSDLSEIRNIPTLEFVTDNPIQINTPDGKIYNVNAERRCWQWIDKQWIENCSGQWYGQGYIDLSALGVPEAHIMITWRPTTMNK